MKWRTPYNYKDNPTKGEVNTMPSETVPDQSMPVREIMRRFASGLPLGGVKVPVYDGEEDLPDHRTLDLADIQEIKENNAQRISEMQRDLQKQKAAKAAKKAAREAASAAPPSGAQATPPKEPK